jgi:heme iron utilization protein
MLNKDQVTFVIELLRAQPVGSLGTLHGGEPFVSMVPFAVLPRFGALCVHVSSLANHTTDMLASPAVSLMVMAGASQGTLPQATPRVTLQCQAAQCLDTDPRYAEATQSYLERFPQSQELFNFGDFSLFVLAPRSMRVVAGFGQATSIVQPELGTVLSAYAASAA